MKTIREILRRPIGVVCTILDHLASKRRLVRFRKYVLLVYHVYKTQENLGPLLK